MAVRLGAYKPRGCSYVMLGVLMVVKRDIMGYTGVPKRDAKGRKQLRGDCFIV